MLDTLGQAILTLWGALGLNADLLGRYGMRMLGGLQTTLLLVFWSVLLGFLLAIPIALARLEGGRALRGIAIGFVTFFRGTPLLAQTFLVYYGAGSFRAELEAAGLWWFFREAWYCAILTFTLNTAAYQAEILRGGLQSLPAGQREGAYALGLGPVATYLRVLLPQALIVGLRPLGNELILMIKASSIASVITVFDLMGTTRLAFARSFDFEVYLWAAALYLLMVETVRRVWAVLERRLTRHLALAR